MKLKGSARIYIQCLECKSGSPFMRVYLFDEDGFIEWQVKDIPEGWALEDEASFYESGDSVYGYCPNHNNGLK